MYEWRQCPMKKYFFLLLFCIFLLVVAGCSGGSEVGILDMNRVLEESSRAAQLDDELTRIGEELESDSNSDRDDEEEEQEEKEEEDLDEIYMEYQDSKRQLEGRLNEEVEDVLEDISRKYDLKIILYNEDIHYGGRRITEEVIEELDSRYYEAGEDTDE
ncbi:MAG: hypothetical protein ACOC5A_01020 [Halanaerobiales bacterium]